MKRTDRWKRAARGLLTAALVAGGLVAASPSGGVVQATPAPNDGVAYDSIPDPLPYPLSSVPFYGYLTEFGDAVQLAPGSRSATSFDTVLTSWVCGNNIIYHASCETEDGATFDHPLTLTFYEWDYATGMPGDPIDSPITQTFAIPYRPSYDPGCQGPNFQFKDENGDCQTYVRVPIHFQFDPIELPRNVVWTVGFETTGRGMPANAACNNNPPTTPRTWCGYDQMNVAIPAVDTPVPAGVDLLSGAVVRQQVDGAFGVWNWASSSGPERRAAGRINTAPATEDSSTVVVRPGAQHGWEFNTDDEPDTGQAGEFVTGPAPAPLGVGSAELAVSAADQHQALSIAQFAGTPLANLTELAYSSSQPEGQLAAALQFSVRYDGQDGPWQGRLVFEPSHMFGDGIVPEGWQDWNTFAGKWWASNAAGAPCVQATPCTWTEILERFPNAVINASDPQVLFKAGSGWATFTGNVDALAIGVIDAGMQTITTTTYDFEPEPTYRDYNPVTPVRLFDSRPGTPPTLLTVPQVKLTPGTTVKVKVTDLVLPETTVPETEVVGAVSLNVTVASTTANGYVTVQPCGSSNVVSSVNFQAGKDRANAVIVPVSASGEICFTSDQTVDVLADLNGWFRAEQGYVPVTPARVFDTRPGAPVGLRDVTKQLLAPGQTLTVKLTDLPGGLIPASGVSAVSLNVTAAGTTADGFITVIPCGTRHEVSSVNFQAGADVANAVIVPVSADGTVCFFSSAPTHLVVDVNSWFKTGSDLQMVTPDRVFDTRPGTPATLRTVEQVKLAAGKRLEVKFTDLPGGIVPAGNVYTVSLNVTTAGAAEAGYLTVTPCGPLGEVSNVNFQANTDTANAVLTGVSATGTVCFYSSTAVDVLVDINSWFKEPTLSS